jgi:hypothetical protein
MMINHKRTQIVSYWPAILHDVPNKLRKKILALEYVEMHDLLLDSWNVKRLQDERPMLPCIQGQSSRASD